MVPDGNRSMDKSKPLLRDKLTGNLESSHPTKPQKIENFGLVGCSISWFTSVFERFVTLSSLTQKELQQQREAYRYHPINWKQKNIWYRIATDGKPQSIHRWRNNK